MSCETEWHHAAGSFAPLADKWTPDEDTRRIHHDSAAKRVTVTSSGKQPGARTSRTSEAFSLQYIETVSSSWSKTIVREFGRLFLFLKRPISDSSTSSPAWLYPLYPHYWWLLIRNLILPSRQDSRHQGIRSKKIVILWFCCPVQTFIKCFWGHTEVHKVLSCHLKPKNIRFKVFFITF